MAGRLQTLLEGPPQRFAAVMGIAVHRHQLAVRVAPLQALQDHCLGRRGNRFKTVFVDVRKVRRVEAAVAGLDDQAPQRAFAAWGMAGAGLQMLATGHRLHLDEFGENPPFRPSAVLIDVEAEVGRPKVP